MHKVLQCTQEVLWDSFQSVVCCAKGCYCKNGARKTCVRNCGQQDACLEIAIIPGAKIIEVIGKPAGI